MDPTDLSLTCDNRQLFVFQILVKLLKIIQSLSDAVTTLETAAEKGNKGNACSRGKAIENYRTAVCV